MNIHLGIVGPEDNVNAVKKILNENSYPFSASNFIYQNVQEALQIVEQEQKNIDVWFFTGQAPYSYVTEQKTLLNAFYPVLNGSSLTKVLLISSLNDNKKLNKISFDTLSEDEIIETFEELQLPTNQLMYYPYDGFKSKEELTHFHKKAFQEKKVDFCVTCVSTVYQELKSLNIPCYRITPTKMAIKRTLSSAAQYGEMIQFKNAQVSNIMIEFPELKLKIGDGTRSYDLHRLHLNIEQEIITFTEAVKGSFVAVGNDLFNIYTTRGVIEKQINQDILSLLEKLYVKTGLKAYIGIGFGYTVMEAENNAYSAIKESRHHELQSVMLVEVDGTVKGPLQTQTTISYQRSTLNTELKRKLSKAGVSIANFNKIQSIQQQINRPSISANEIADWLNMTERNVRRILNQLESVGLCKVVGTEAPGSRGRPRRLYHIKEDF